MPQSWFVRGSGKVYGPLDSAKLKQLVASGKIDQNTEVAQQHHGPWFPAGRVKGLFVQPPLPAPAPAPQIPPATLTQKPSQALVASATPSPKKQGGYVDSNLLPNESVIYRGRLHWLFFLRPILWIAFAFLLFFMSSSFSEGDEDAGRGAIVVGVLLLLIGIVSAISHAITYKTSEFAVTTRRVIMKQGFIRRKTMELMLGKVDSLAVDQGILGRMFGYGTVRVTVATEKQSFPFLSDPLEFRRQVQIQTPG
jgi:membrane protein YdbS with pleckstrin-like domain